MERGAGSSHSVRFDVCTVLAASHVCVCDYRQRRVSAATSSMLAAAMEFDYGRRVLRARRGVGR